MKSLSPGYCVLVTDGWRKGERGDLGEIATRLIGSRKVNLLSKVTKAISTLPFGFLLQLVMKRSQLSMALPFRL